MRVLADTALKATRGVVGKASTSPMVLSSAGNIPLTCMVEVAEFPQSGEYRSTIVGPLRELSGGTDGATTRRATRRICRNR
ncbi:hypothetical protein Pmi06nite_25360 [Planotetraspora mira]|uniref:Uncharacterized protein n=1 Tax=Planotetraspora mira TaxID=58121 RepID=A0A8J3TN17_9ACTN|nr:hypothetical protein Pmi06nite_25360 [Planotetraspora mira]